MSRKLSLFASGVAIPSLIWGGAAVAQSIAAATTDLNIRSDQDPSSR